MRNFHGRRGMAMLHVIILGTIILALATAVIRWQLQRHHLAAENLRRSQLAGDVETLRNSISACLAEAGYPSGSCTPNAAQSACVPAGVAVVFGGTPPSCEIKIAASR